MTNIATKLLKPLETSSSIGMFVRDTGGCLLSRVGLARSKDEKKEVTLAEVSESAIFYFSTPLLAKTSADIFSKANKIDKNTMTTPINELKNLSADQLKKVKLSKFGQIASTFALVLPLVYAIAPVRNLFTEQNTGKESFVSVIELEKQKENKSTKTPKDKAIELIKKLSAITLASFGAIAGIMTLAKNEGIYKKIEPFITGIVKKFDFTKNCDLETIHYAALIYPFSILGYFKASRDKYEVKENIRRFSVTVPMLLFGDKVIQNPIHRFFDKKFNTSIIDSKNSIKTYDDIFKMTGYDKKQALKAKNASIATTYAISTILIAAAVTLLNRFKTKHDYENDNNLTQNQQKG